jgi:hypothetical protein
VTIRERIEAAYQGQACECVPWTCYGGLLGRGQAERRLRNRGLGLVGITRTFAVSQPNVDVRTQTVSTDDGPMTRTTYATPVGEVFELHTTEPGYGSSWKKSHMIQRLEDYAVVEFMVRDIRYTSTTAEYDKAMLEMGDDGVVFVATDRSPLQKMWVETPGRRAVRPGHAD